MSKSYKPVLRTTTLSAAIADAMSELAALGEEARELVDNASEMSQGTQRIQTFDETASALENLVEPNIDGIGTFSDLDVEYTEQVHRSRKASPSRAVRCGNACAMLSAAHDRLDDLIANGGIDEWEGSNVRSAIGDESSPSRGEVFDAIGELIGELAEIISEAEGCEFPGMFG